ncbi:LLM class F420-dependent oxidoreductase [Tsukamurella sp. 1534]|uniref:LLM class F420-dependent oxidoreductase n=1 Tax=Tsukamurella sp. 1534 TaxID=1151061 RepID=UPI0002D4012E|nr:LLM class F420-dependent oxidoreductase [Tsukamurella sp. 1534]
MRFGLFIPQGWRLDLVGIDPADQWSTMSGLASRADTGPWDSIWVYDHFHTVPVATHEATHEAWTLMSAFAATTERIKLGQMCTAMSYRNPAYLAKVAATVDLISGGRTQMGIGAGWYEHEWRAYGYGFPPPGERLGRLEEGVQILQQAWRDGVSTLDGKYYQVDGAICEPKPLQDGGLPLWLAGGGEKRTLKIAAKYAQYTNFDGTFEGFAHKSDVLKQHCAEVGTDFDAITRSANYNIAIGETATDVQWKLDEVRRRYAAHAPIEESDATMGAFYGMPGVGTPSEIVDNLTKLEAQGMTYAICYFPELAYDTTGLELFEREVISAFS